MEHTLKLVISIQLYLRNIQLTLYRIIGIICDQVFLNSQLHIDTSLIETVI